MDELVFLYPGQGAQYVGMGKELADRYSIVEQTFAEADEALGFGLSRLCFEGPEEELTLTENTQPAVLAVSVALTRLLADQGLRPAAAAGLSLGEYSALVAANALAFDDALRLVQKRGRYMQEAVPEGVGTMAAIIGLSREEVEAICSEVSNGSVVEPANYNCPGQIVISGHVEAVEEGVRMARERGAKRAIELAVSAPFHSRLLEPAAEQLASALEAVQLGTAEIPVVANVTGEYVTGAGTIRDSLIQQVISPVRWEESMETFLEAGRSTYVEVGPGRVLKGFMRRIERGATMFSVEDQASLDNLFESLEEVC